MQKKPRWGLITLATFVVAALVVTLAAWMQQDRDPREELKKRVMELQSQGVPFDVQEVVRPPVREDPNPYSAAIEALPYDAGLRVDHPDTPMLYLPDRLMQRELVWLHRPDQGQRPSPQAMRLLEQMLEKRAEALDRADRAAQEPAHGFYVELKESGEPDVVAQMEDLHEMFAVLALRALRDAYLCRSDELGASLLSLSAVPPAIGEPLVVEEALARAHMSALLTVHTLYCLDYCTMPADSLARLQQALAALEEDLGAGQVITARRAWLLQKLPPGWRDLSVTRGLEKRDIASITLLTKLDALHLAETVLGLSPPEQLQQATRLENFMQGAGASIVLVGARRTADNLALYIVDETEARARLRLTRVLLAAERYRLGHGEWPADMQDLVPELLAEIPADPGTGGSLGYRVEPDGVVAFSREPDEVPRSYDALELKLLNPQDRGIEGPSFHQQVMDLPDWDPPMRARALYRLGFTREELGEAGFTTQELGGWGPGMERPPRD